MPSNTKVRSPAAGQPAAGISDFDHPTRAVSAVNLHVLGGDLLVLRAAYRSQRFTRHTHEGYALGVIETGALAFRYRGEGLVAPAGQISLAQPGIPHDGAPAGPDGWSYRMLYLPSGMLAYVMPDKAALPFFRPGVIKDPAFARQVATTHARLLDPAMPALAKESLLLTLLAGWVARHAEHGPAPSEPGPEPRAVRRTLEILGEHFADDIRLTDLARTVGLTPWHLVRVVTRATGQPPHAHLLDRRCQVAQEKLRGPERLADIAAATGFADQSHLTRTFLAHFGLTPGTYRKILQNSAGLPA